MHLVLEESVQGGGERVAAVRNVQEDADIHVDDGLQALGSSQRS